MAENALVNYASPYLRKRVFDQLYPDSEVSYEIIPIDEAFPSGHTDDPGGATEAVRCTIVTPSGWWVEGCKEIDLRDQRGRAVPQTPETYVKDQTKALGRALRDAGIPQKVDELMALMRWITALEGKTPLSAKGRPIDPDSGEISGSSDPDEVDSPDAGVEPTLEQVLAMKFGQLNGADKRDVSTYAREELSVANVMRAGVHAEAILAFIDKMRDGTPDPLPEEEPL